jgi:hypothetical protein
MSKIVVRTVWLLLFTPALVGTQGSLLKVDNSYTYDQNGFAWRVFIKEDGAVLDTISCVEYTLHPTFPNPIQRRCNAGDQFGLAARGWGEFTILLKVEWKDGKVTTQSYMLDLHSPSRNAKSLAPPTQGGMKVNTRSSAIEAPVFDKLDSQLQGVLNESKIASLGGASGAELYNKLGDQEKAQFLNIYAKMKATKLPSGKSLFDYVLQFVSLDRVILVARTRIEMRDQVRQSSSPSTSFRRTGPTGDYTVQPPYSTDESFKTLDPHGWLHLTFYRNKNAAEDYLVGIDMHARASSFGHAEHSPRSIYEILTEEQKINPPYSWVP